MYLTDTCRHRPCTAQSAQRAEDKSQTLTEHEQHFHGKCQSANNSVDADDDDDDAATAAAAAAAVVAALRDSTRVSPSGSLRCGIRN